MTTNNKFTANHIPDQHGQRILITGANSGIGYETALELARKGAEVIIPARSIEKANLAIARIKTEIPDAKLIPALLDLSSLASVRTFADFVTEKFPGQSLNLLINNAGVMAVPKRELTIDGFERQFATNYLGPFLLTSLLFPLLKEQEGTRIATVASGVSNAAQIDFDNLQSERIYKPMFGAYSQSKLADLIFQIELQRRLTAAHGALPTLFAATSPKVIPGGYYGPDGIGELKRVSSTSKNRASSQ